MRTQLALAVMCLPIITGCSVADSVNHSTPDAQKTSQAPVRGDVRACHVVSKAAEEAAAAAKAGQPQSTDAPAGDVALMAKVANVGSALVDAEFYAKDPQLDAALQKVKPAASALKDDQGSGEDMRQVIDAVPGIRDRCSALGITDDTPVPSS